MRAIGSSYVAGSGDPPMAHALGHHDTGLAMVSGDALRSIVALEDALGVVSMYVGVLPEAETGRRAVWELELRHELERARIRLDREGDAASAVAFDRRLEELGEELELLVSPHESGRGRALFAGLTGGAAIRFAQRRPFRTRVEVGGCALTRPLASALEAGRPAGIALLSEHELRLFEWRSGEVEKLQTISVPDFEERHRLLGPSAARPRGAPQAGPGVHAGQQRDLHERRVEEARGRFVAHALELEELAGKRGWGEVVLGGEPGLAEGLLEHVGEQGSVEVLVEPRLLGWLTASQLAGVVGPGLERARARRQLAELERVRGEALAGRRGAIGLADTLAALGEGRVERLLLPAERELRGSRAPDGTLFPPGVEPPGLTRADRHSEEFLAERMIRRALATDADITLLRCDAEAALGDDDAAALLRW